MRRLPRFRSSRLLPFALAATLPLAAQWAAPVIALHLKSGRAEDQLGLGEGPDSDYYGKVDREGNIVIPDNNKKRFMIYSPAGALIRVIKAPDDVANKDEYWPEEFLLHPAKHLLLVKARDAHYCLFDYSGSVRLCFRDPRPGSVKQAVDYISPNGFILKDTADKEEMTASRTTPRAQSLCFYIDTDRPLEHNPENSFSIPGKCGSEPEEWNETGNEKKLSLDGVTFNAAEMAKPDGWHYVLINRKVAIGRCAEDNCSYSAFPTGGKQLAEVKLPYQEMIFDLAPNGDLYSIRQYHKNEIILYKRAWTGTGAPKTAAKPAPPPRPMYYDRELVFEDLDRRTLRELDLLRNTIYARAGNPFRKAWLHDYFTAQPWYKPLEKMDEKQLTDLDKKNARLIMEYSLEQGEADLRETAEKLQQRAAKGSLTAEEKIEVRLLSIRLGKWYGSEKDKAEYQPNPLENPARLDQPITLEDLGDFSRRDLRLLRNTVYARRGKPFTSETLGGYFSGMDWYHADPQYHDKRLNGVDKRNIEVIISLERTLGGPMSEKEAQNEQMLEGA